MSKIIYTKALIDLIVGCLFDGLTDGETACLAHIPVKTVSRLRLGEEFPQIREATIARMRKYIALIRDGEDRSNRWQRIAWFLERRYPDRWAKPEVLLNVNTAQNNVTNNTLVITAEQAANYKARAANLANELDKLVLPGSKAAEASMASSLSNNTDSLASGKKDSVLAREGSVDSSLPESDDKSTSKTSSNDVVEAPGATPAGTPGPGAPDFLPILTPKFKNVASSKNYSPTTEENPVKTRRKRGERAAELFSKPPYNIKPPEPVQTIVPKETRTKRLSGELPLPAKKRGRPPKVLRGRPKGSKNKAK